MNGSPARDGADRAALLVWILVLLAAALGIWLGATLYAIWSAVPATG